MPPKDPRHDQDPSQPGLLERLGHRLEDALIRITDLPADIRDHPRVSAITERIDDALIKVGDAPGGIFDHPRRAAAAERIHETFPFMSPARMAKSRGGFSDLHDGAVREIASVGDEDIAALVDIDLDSELTRYFAFARGEALDAMRAAAGRTERIEADIFEPDAHLHEMDGGSGKISLVAFTDAAHEHPVGYVTFAIDVSGGPPESEGIGPLAEPDACNAGDEIVYGISFDAVYILPDYRRQGWGAALTCASFILLAMSIEQTAARVAARGARLERVSFYSEWYSHGGARLAQALNDGIGSGLEIGTIDVPGQVELETEMGW